MRNITKEAAAALSSIGIQCLNVQSNPRLVKLPVKELCDIPSLLKLECTGCPRLESPPMEVAEQGATLSMDFLRDCVNNGTLNESLALFLVGGGECGLTVARKIGRASCHC